MRHGQTVFYVVVTGGGDKSRAAAVHALSHAVRPAEANENITSEVERALGTARRRPRWRPRPRRRRRAPRAGSRARGRASFRAARRTVRVPGPRARPRGVSDHPLLEQFGDAGAPKPGTLQSPPLYVKRTLRGGQTVRHPGSVIVRHISRVPSPDALEARARARDRRPAAPGPLSAFSLSSFLPALQRAFLHDFFFVIRAPPPAHASDDALPARAGSRRRGPELRGDRRR